MTSAETEVERNVIYASVFAQSLIASDFSAADSPRNQTQNSKNVIDKLLNRIQP